MALSSLNPTIQYPYTFSLGTFQHIGYIVILLYIHKMKYPFNQSHFFQLLRYEIEPQTSIYSFLEDLLGWSRTTTYKKMSGERLIKMEEFFMIVGKLPVLAMSIAEVFKVHDLKLVQMHSVSSLRHFQKYLEGIETLLKEVASDVNHLMHYSASDLPLLYYFQYPELLRYKWTFWSNQAAPHQALPFLPPAIIHAAKRIYALYNSINSKELWQWNALQTQFQNLAFRTSENLVLPNDASILHEQLQQIEQEIAKSALSGKKQGGGLFEARIRPDLSFKNSCYFRFHQKEFLNCSYSSLNYFRSSSEKSCNLFVDAWAREWATATPFASRGETHWKSLGRTHSGQ